MTACERLALIATYVYISNFKKGACVRIVCAGEGGHTCTEVESASLLVFFFFRRATRENDSIQGVLCDLDYHRGSITLLSPSRSTGPVAYQLSDFWRTRRKYRGESYAEFILLFTRRFFVRLDSVPKLCSTQLPQKSQIHPTYDVRDTQTIAIISLAKSHMCVTFLNKCAVISHAILYDPRD